MEKREEILNELNSIAPLLAGISVKMPYTVPAGYFGALPQNILALLNVAENESSMLIQTNPFTVPSGYFDTLAEVVLRRIKEEEEFSFSLNAKQMPYKIPNGYFEEFTSTVLQKIRGEEVKTELAAIAPLLGEIPKSNVYSIPSGYFNTLKVPETATPKVVKMAALNWVRFAAAAVVIGVLAIGAFIIVGKNSTDISFDATAYKKAINTNIDTAVSSVNDKDLEKFLAEHAVVASVPEEEVEKNLPEVKELMNLISDEELQESLKEQTVVESSGS